MARPKEFDRDDALARAIELFADRGYEGTSTDALLKAMGLNRQSLYDTYGSKRLLYLEALRRYNRDSVSNIVVDIAAGPTPLDGLERALTSFVTRATERPDPSCLGVGAICEFGLRDPDVLAAGEPGHAELVAAVSGALERGKRDGQVRGDVDSATATDLILATLVGLKVGARGGLGAPRLREIARLAIAGLRAERAAAGATAIAIAPN